MTGTLEITERDGKVDADDIVINIAGERVSLSDWIAATQKQIERTKKLEDALRFYANPDNWDSTPKLGTSANGDVLQISEGYGYDIAAEALAND